MQTIERYTDASLIAWALAELEDRLRDDRSTDRFELGADMADALAGHCRALAATLTSNAPLLHI